MTLPDLKDLGKVLDLCRKKGVKAIQLGELRIELGELPEKQTSSINEAQENPIDPANPYANFPQGNLTPDQLIYYSSGGVPENDPALAKSDQ